MKAVVIKNGAERQYVAVTDMAAPALSSPDQVLIKLIRVGLDGTDREIICERYGVLPEGAEQMVIGHEMLGVIVQAGEQSGLSEGQLVTALVRRPCEDESCVCCRSGRQDFCESGSYTERGIRGADGFIAEYAVEHARYVVPLPNSCTEYGVLVEPQSIVEKVLNQLDIVQRRTAWEPKSTLIMGSGPLGILTALTCLTMGLETHVWSKSPVDSLNAELIRQAGGIYHEAVPWQGDPSVRSFGSGMDERMTALGIRPDLIWECSGHIPLAFEAMKVLNANGVLAMLGCSAADSMLSIPCELIGQEIVLRNKCIIGSVNASRYDFETAIARLEQIEAAFPGMLERLLTDRLKMDQLPELDFAQISVKAVVELG